MLGLRASELAGGMQRPAPTADAARRRADSGRGGGRAIAGPGGLQLVGGATTTTTTVKINPATATGHRRLYNTLFHLSNADVPSKVAVIQDGPTITGPPAGAVLVGGELGPEGAKIDSVSS